MLKRLMKIASQIASDFMNEKEAFDMTQREWEIYKDKHPLADPANHHIIKVKGKPHSKNRHKKYMRKEKKAKVAYFKKMKRLHPNYVPMIKKDEFMDMILNGEYSCISAGVNPSDPMDVERCKDKKYLEKRIESLRKDLDELGVIYTEVAGCYKSKEEPSFLISHTLKSKVSQKVKDDTFLIPRNVNDGKDKNDEGNVYINDNDIITKLNKLGAKYHQDSVSHAKNGRMEWHYTTGEDAGYRDVGKDTKFIQGTPAEYSEARIGEDEYTVWSCDMSNTFAKGYVKQKNPYF